MNDRQTPHSRSPRRKKRGHPILKFFLTLFIACILAGLAVVVAARNEIQGSNPTGETALVEVKQGQSVSAVADSLKQAGVIRYPKLFCWVVREKNAVNKIQYGTFTLGKGISYEEILRVMSQYAAADSTRVTFPEGSTAFAIAAKMEEAGLCSAEEFLEVANTADFSQFRFWQELPTDEEAPNRFLKCEGYLFPETYEFLKDDTVYNYVATFYKHFDLSITDEMYAKLEEQGMTLPELITLASFVQEEAGNEQDDNVAQVFRNRLAVGSRYPRLQSNASSYVQSDADNNYLWNWVAPYYGGWDQIPADIMAAYDTYQCKGLPAGPISNPGLAAIQASLDPQPDEEAKAAYFFVTDLKGTYYYGRTESEHAQNCKKARAVNRSMK